MKELFLKKYVMIIFLLILIQLASADLFIVSVDEWIDCQEQNEVIICQKNPAYKLMEKDIIPNINTNYYDEVLDDVMESKNEKIEKLENQVTGYATYNSEINDWYSAMEKVYLTGIVVLALLLVNAYFQIYKLKRKRWKY